MKLQEAQNMQNFAWNMYGTVRADEIRMEDLARSDSDFIRQIKLKELQYQRDIARDDMVSARNALIEIEALKENRSYTERLARLKNERDMKL